MGKTLIAGHILKHKNPPLIIVIAPLKISVKNLQDRLDCFLSGYKKLLIDSDTEGTTDETIITKFLKDDGIKVLYSTYTSFINIIGNIFNSDNNEYILDNTFILVDEVHNVGDEECGLISQFNQGLVMSATYPDNLSLDINETFYVPFSLGILRGYYCKNTIFSSCYA